MECLPEQLEHFHLISSMLRLSIYFCNLLRGLVCRGDQAIRGIHQWQGKLMDYESYFCRFGTVSVLDVEMTSAMQLSKMTTVNYKNIYVNLYLIYLCKFRNKKFISPKIFWKSHEAPDTVFRSCASIASSSSP